MFANALNPIIAKNGRKFDDKRKDYISKEIIANEEKIVELKKESKKKITTKLYKNSLVLSFNFILFLMGMVLKSMKLFFSQNPSPIRSWGEWVLGVTNIIKYSRLGEFLLY